jgi:diguanylate cyclase (GGDEF)-like protein
MRSVSVKRYSLTVLLLVFLVARPVAALDPLRNLIEFNLQTWQTQQGLHHNMVQSIAQTPDGYLWFGTWEGVARFNGFEFTIFNPQNVPELKDRGVRALLVAQDGALWMGTTRGGVTRHKDGEWTTFTRDDGLAGNEVLCLAEDTQGRIWVGTEADGVGIIDQGQFKVITPQQGLNDKAVLAIAERHPGEMWLTTRNGVVRIIDDEVTAFGQDDGLPSGPVLSVFSDPRGSLLFGTQNGIYLWRDGAFQPHLGWLSGGRGQVSKLLVDSDGALWAGTFSDGLFRVLDTGVDGLKTHTGLPNNRISALFEDLEGNLWVGTSGGLARLKSAPFSVLSMRNGLSDNYVRAVLEAKDGSMWIATSNGLNQVDGSNNRVYTTADGLASNSVLSLLETEDGSLWVGTYGAGINILREGKVVDLISAPESLPGNHIRSMVETRDGSIWVGAIGGLARFRDGKLVQMFTDENGLPRAFVQSLFEDLDGTLWVGTVEGLARVRDGQIESLTGVLEGYDGSDVFGFHRDAAGHFWIATENGLLNLTVDDVARPINRGHGLPHDVIFGLESDALGYLWMTSNAGIFRARIDELLRLVSGQIDRVHFDRYTEDHGLSSRQANGGSEPSLIKASTNRLWFATAIGVAVIDPHILATEVERLLPPRPVVESVVVDGAARTLSKPLVISPGARHFEIYYAGLSFRSPENIQYRVQLKNFEPPRQAGTERIAHYTNLDPGRYSFQLWAAHPNGEWVGPPASIELVIKPFFYETRWFLASVALAILLAVWGTIRLRIANLRRSAQELGRQVASRTRDLKQQTRHLEQANNEKTELLEKLEEQSKAFERQARQDALTGLANRRGFDEILHREFETARASSGQLALAVMDVDHFKQVNDQFSHQVGDNVLKILARLMQEVFATRGTPARYGGEEFVVLFPGMDIEAARKQAEALRVAVEGYDFSDLGAGLQVTISIGVSDRIDVPNHEKLFSAADGKLYQAKTGGRNRVVA